MRRAQRHSQLRASDSERRSSEAVLISIMLLFCLPTLHYFTLWQRRFSFIARTGLCFWASVGAGVVQAQNAR